MAAEALGFGELLEREELAEPLRRTSAEAINYLLRTVDVIPPGIEDLGYLEVLFAFRALAQRTVREHPGLATVDAGGQLGQLASEAELVQAFLKEDFARLSQRVAAPGHTSAHGRSADELLADADARSAALAALRSWAEGYVPPELGSGPEELVKLASFMRTRLAQAS